ncbi:MAG: hypothetical protein NWE75_03480 [Candidatus Bathyarchaeota archaeon]|nr:hypothetical protein [Candidatus Bathyarchaeota archaeon]
MSFVSDPVKIGECKVEPGTRGSRCLVLTDFFADGQPVEIPFLVVNGAEPGRCLYIQVAQHG